MYKHQDFDYQPQHPMLIQQRQQRGYSIEEEGMLDSIKSGLAAVGNAVSKGAKAAMEAGAGLIGKSTAKKMTKANKAKWHAYYLQEKAIRDGKIPQKEVAKAKKDQKELRERLIKESEGVISPDDAKK
jgi:hypothetical protein